MTTTRKPQLKAVPVADGQREPQWQRGTAIDRTYDFAAQPASLRRIVYHGASRFHYRRWWVRWLLWWRR